MIETANRPVIAIGGENLIDRVQTPQTDGTLSIVNNPGGSPFNVAVALSRQGGNTHYLTPISTDDMGALLAGRLEEAGVHIASPRRAEPTTLAVVTLKDGIPTYEFHRDGTAERQVTVDGVTAIMPAGTAALHVGSLALIEGDDAAAWEALFHQARSNGVFVALDPNVRASLIHDGPTYRARMMRLFKAAHLIKMSDEDLEWIYPGKSLADAFDALCADAEAALIVLTKGGDGAEGVTKNHHVRIAAPKVEGLRDTIGAGDTFMGTLLATLAAMDALDPAKLAAFDADDITALLRRAAQAAALNCAREGCDPPTLAELDAALA